MRDGWVETKLGEVAQVLSGYAFKSINFNKFEGTPLIRIRDLQKTNQTEVLSTETYNDRYLVRKGDFLIGMDGEFHCYEWNGPEALLNQRICRIQDFKFELVKPRFIFFAVNQYLEKIEQDTGYTTVKHISTRQILEINFPLPPLAEQKRIVDLISSVDSYIEALQQQVDKARKSRNAVLHEMLTKGGDGWVETKLGEICEIYQPKTIAKSLMNDSGNYIVYGANGPIGRFDEYNHENSEVVVTCRGATCGTVNKTPQKTWITGNAMVLKPKNDSLLRDFLFLSLTSYVDLKSCISGSAQPQITREGLSPQKILIPPLAEQKRIVEIISVFDNQIEALDSTLAKTKNLRSALLSDLLSGNHEIPTTYDKLIGAA
jgi:type I restriction enzyme, S subunit